MPCFFSKKLPKIVLIGHKMFADSIQITTFANAIGTGTKVLQEVTVEERRDG